MNHSLLATLLALAASPVFAVVCDSPQLLANQTIVSGPSFPVNQDPAPMTQPSGEKCGIIIPSGAISNPSPSCQGQYTQVPQLIA